MYHGICDLLEQASSSNSIRAVLLTAEGSTFTAGNDLAEFMSLSGDFTNSPQGRFVRTITSTTKPSLQRCMEGQSALAPQMLLHCDLVYGSPDLKLSTPSWTWD